MKKLRAVLLHLLVFGFFAFDLNAQTASPSVSPTRRSTPPSNLRPSASPSIPANVTKPDAAKKPSVSDSAKLLVISSKSKPSASTEKMTAPPKPAPLTAQQKQQVLSGKTGGASMTLDSSHLTAKADGMSAEIEYWIAVVNSSWGKVGGKKDDGELLIKLRPTAAGQHFLVDCAVIPSGEMNQFTVNDQPYQPMIGLKTHLLFEAMAEDTTVITISIKHPTSFQVSSCEITLLKN